MPAEVWYATREEVKAALDSKETARNNAQIARLIGASTDSIENDQLRRRFYPEIDTRAFDWPTHVDPSDGSRTLSLGHDELASAPTTLKVSGSTIAPGDYTPLPLDGGPPYTAIEFASTVTLSGAARRAVEITGPFGSWNVSTAAGALAAAIPDAAATTITVSDSAAIGTGQLLLVDTERMIVDRKSMVDTGQNLAGNLVSQTNAEMVPVGSGAAFVEGEVVLVDAEKMLIVEIAGNTLIVRRAWDGSTLAAHTTGADVYAPRQLTVRRGMLGTTAVGHSNGAAITKHVVPKLVNQLCVAETITAFMQENAGYGRTIGSGDAQREDIGAGLPDLRERVWQAHGRRVY